MQPEVVDMMRKWSFRSCAARIVAVGCGTTAVIVSVCLGAQVGHPFVVNPVAVRGVLLVDDDDDWVQQQQVDEQETEEAEQEAEEQNELAEQQALQDEQQGLLTEQQAQLSVPGS